MKIMAVDDEKFALLNFENALKEIDQSEIEYLGGFGNPNMALDYAKDNQIDLAFLDIEMPGMSGIELAKRLRKQNSEIKIVFVTGYDMYALQAFEVDAIGYLLKPYRTADLEKQINKARLILPQNVLFKKRIFIRTMPKFDMFADDKLVVFLRSKSKEMLAYLVDKKGSTATMGEIINVLWEDREYDSKVKMLYREAIMSLRKTLESVDASEIFGVSKGMCYIDVTKFDCDLYSFLDDKRTGVFSGQYMSEYSWAEETVAQLENIAKNINKRS